MKQCLIPIPQGRAESKGKSHMPRVDTGDWPHPHPLLLTPALCHLHSCMPSGPMWCFWVIDLCDVGDGPEHNSRVHPTPRTQTPFSYQVGKIKT